MAQFEQQVIQTVADALDHNDYNAKFYEGTLFLESNEDDARKVFHRLTQQCGLGYVVVSEIDNEYAFDFI